MRSSAGRVPSRSRPRSAARPSRRTADASRPGTPAPGAPDERRRGRLMNPQERTATDRRPIWRHWPLWAASPVAAFLLIGGYYYLSEEQQAGPSSASSKSYEIPPAAELTPEQIDQ